MLLKGGMRTSVVGGGWHAKRAEVSPSYCNFVTVVAIVVIGLF